MLSRPPFKVGPVVMSLEPFEPEVYSSRHVEDNDLKHTYQRLKEDCDIVDAYHLEDDLLYKDGKSCVPKDSRLKLIPEAHTSLHMGHFGVLKTVENLQRFKLLVRSISVDLDHVSSRATTFIDSGSRYAHNILLVLVYGLAYPPPPNSQPPPVEGYPMKDGYGHPQQAPPPGKLSVGVMDSGKDVVLPCVAAVSWICAFED
ncbi:hypothetical protein HHK36_023209 [Tetracentron sinense]|uniref:Integrase zinc-binding domain-containing protein n=1 Tax=Tetracentron sinense TaxID=13715 RepID=A0A834YNB4_TETSI|nr:hypothetical protein HHK36_023209 [Tetracentron sinense]